MTGKPESYPLPKSCPFCGKFCRKTVDEQKNEKYSCDPCGRIFIVFSWKTIGMQEVKPRVKQYVDIGSGKGVSY